MQYFSEKKCNATDLVGRQLTFSCLRWWKQNVGQSLLGQEAAEGPLWISDSQEVKSLKGPGGSQPQWGTLGFEAAVADLERTQKK